MLTPDNVATVPNTVMVGPDIAATEGTQPWVTGVMVKASDQANTHCHKWIHRAAHLMNHNEGTLRQGGSTTW